MRSSAAAAIGEFGYADAAGELTEALKDEDDGVRSAAKASLKRIGAPAAAPKPPAPAPASASAPPPPNGVRSLLARDVSVLLRAVSAALADAPTVTVGSVELTVAATAILQGKSASPAALHKFVAVLGKSPTLKKMTQPGGKRCRRTRPGR